MTKATLLLVVGEPFDEAQKTLILDRIFEELNGGWDDASSGCNLQKQLDNLVASKSVSNADLGAVVTHDAEDLSTTILFNPERKQLHETLQNFLLIDSNYRHLVYAGLTMAGTGSWILRDDVFTFRDFVRVLKDMDSVGAEGNGKGFSLTLGLAHDGDWSKNNLSKLSSLGVRFSTENTEKRYDDFSCFRDFLSHLVTVTDLKDLLKSSDTVGTINFSSPTLYIFPGGNGSSSLFGVRGFTALVDGGYGHKPCFWDFSRHIQQIDLMLLTHLSVNNILGVQSFLERKMETGLPEVGSVFFNCPEKFKKSSNANGLKLNLFQSGTTFAETLNAVGLPPQSCYSLQPTHPITLYNKVGFGSVDMYVLNPIQNTEEMRSFLNQWTIRAESDCFSSGAGVPMSNSLSVSILLVWKPFAQNGKIVRILFPGGSPQSKIFEGLDRLKNVALFERANCLQVESNDKSQNVGGKPGRVTQGRTGLKPAVAKVNGDAEATKSKPDNRNPVAAKPKEPVNSKSVPMSRSAKVDVKLPEKQVASTTSKTNAEAKPSLGKVSSPQKTSAKEVKPKPVENHLTTKKPTAKPSDVELTPKAKALKPAEVGKQANKPAKRPEVLESPKMTAAKPRGEKKEEKAAAKPEAAKQTKTPEAVKQRGAVKQTKATKDSDKISTQQPEADKKEGQVELEKKDPEKQIEAPEEIPTKSKSEAEDKLNVESAVDRVPVVVAKAEHSDNLPDQNDVLQSLGVDSEPAVVEDVVRESETSARGSEFGLPSPEDVAQMSQEEDDSCVEELPAEVEPPCEAVIPVVIKESREETETEDKIVFGGDEETGDETVCEISEDVDVDFVNDFPAESEPICKEEITKEEDNGFEMRDEICVKDEEVLSGPNGVCDNQNDIVPDAGETLHLAQHLDNGDFENNKDLESAEADGIKSDQQDFSDHDDVQDLDNDAEEDKEEVCDQDHEVHDNQEIQDHNYYHKDLPEEDIKDENDDLGLEIKTGSELEKQDVVECRNEEEIKDISPSHEDPLAHDFEKGAEDEDEDDDLDAVPEEEEEEEVEYEGGIEGDSSCQEPEFEFLSAKHMTQSAVAGALNEESAVDGSNREFADEISESSEVLCTLKKDEAFENLAALCLESKDVVSASDESAILTDLSAPCSDDDVTKLWTTSIMDAEETTETLNIDPECVDYDDVPNPALLQSGETGDLQGPSQIVESPDDADVNGEYGNVDRGDETGSNSDSEEAPFNGNAVKEERVEVAALDKEQEDPETQAEDFLPPQSEVIIGDDECQASDIVSEKETYEDPRILEEVKDGNFNLGFDCSENLSVENQVSLEADASLKEKSGEDSGESDLDVGQESFDPYRTERFDDRREEDYKRDDGFEDECPADLLDLGPQQEPQIQSVDFNQGLTAEDEAEARRYDVPGSGRKTLNPFCDPDFNESELKGYDPFAQPATLEKEDENESTSENSDADELNEFVRTELSTQAAMALLPSGESTDDIGGKTAVYEHTPEFADEDELSKSDEISHLERQSSQDSRPLSFWSPDNGPLQEIVPGRERTGASDNVLFGEEAIDVEKDINENLDVSNSTDDAQVEEGALTGSITSSAETHLHSAVTADLIGLDAEDEVDPVKSWGQPMGLPAPTQDRTTLGRPKTRLADAANLSLPVGDRSMAATQRKANETRRSMAPKPIAASQGEAKEAKESKSAANKKQFEAGAAAKAKKATGLASAETASKSRPLKHVVPFYVDLTYIPGNGDPAFVDADFFRRVRAKYYVLSALDPDPRVLSCLVEGKQTWENKDLSVDVIPTYDSDALHRWRHENAKLLEDLKITILPAANKCTIKLQADKDDGCCAFRVEF